MSNKLRSHGKSMVVWVLLALLILGLGGFGMTNFSGQIDSIGAVGETEIPVNDYARALQDEMNRATQQIGRPFTLAEARTMGLDSQVQAVLFGRAALREAAREIGISAGDAALHEQITQSPGFQGMDGKFDREAYRLTLRQQGQTEAEFETRLRADLGSSILQTAVATGIPASEAAIDAYTAFITETRTISWAEVTEADLTEAVGNPDDAALQAYYEANPDRFTRPATREISYVWLTPDMLRDKVELDEEMMRAAYEARIDEFVQPERRMVERLVYPSREEAEAAKARFDAGEASFADLAAERGLTLEDADLGEPSQDDLGAAGEAVFALDAPGVVGPIETDLGPALFSMNAIILAQETTFEEAREELSAEAALDRARRMIGDMTTDLEDRLAGGATLEDMANETDMVLGTVSVGGEAEDDILGYEGFREAAGKVTAEDFPELANLEDGGVFALRLDGETPASVIPFEEARADVETAWRADELQRLKRVRAEEIVATVDAGADLAASGLIVTTQPDLPRRGFVEGAPQGFADAAFEAENGKAAVVEGPGQVLVLRVESINAADTESEAVQQMRDTVKRQLSQTLANDVLNFYARAAQDEAGLTVDSAAIAAVQAQLQ